MKRIIKDYLYFSKQERMAVVILLLVMALFIIAPYWYMPKIDPPVINQALVDWLSQSENGDVKEAVATVPSINKPVMFAFDPNTVSEDGWMRLGLSQKTIRTILNYRSKGGKFRQAGDLKKIWGMPAADAERLMPYVQIAGTEAFANTSAKKIPVATKKEPAVIDINTAGIEEWASLPGIGDAFANRIVRYRDRLGGFRSVQQVGKTYGISDSLFNSLLPYLRYDAASMPKTNLNSASAYTLKQAGIDSRLAYDLVRYREKNGAYKSLAELHKLLDMPDSNWQKLVQLIRVE